MRVLVSVASKHGSTAEIATALAAAMRHHGAQVDVCPPHRVDDVDGYDVVVLGSAVYRGRWLRTAREFAERYASPLRGRAVYLFSSGPVVPGDRPVNTPYDACAVAERLDAREHRTFPGKLDPAVLNTGERMVVRMVGAPPGDFRDWDAVGSWGAHIVASTTAGHEESGREESGREESGHEESEAAGTAPAQQKAGR
ncbi:flavodoxin domain-containing protein [Rhodococcus sp. Z13]|uniref:Flavodoxin domain-containing protein n=1 Tax=Rhodococcus sacchari TaxID=2962047 RepID=A0ACD4DHV0_9NOCA|nr:flavodoxin domain-containing protein [Rhodococcus sp. Z13]UYP19650.1 flavodoxin domain-containing protein [Rhodococcus sp. Z13]